MSSYDEYFVKILMDDGTTFHYTNIPEILLKLDDIPKGAFHFNV